MEILSSLEWISRNTTSRNIVAWVKSSDGFGQLPECWGEIHQKSNWANIIWRGFHEPLKSMENRRTPSGVIQDIDQGGVNLAHETEPLPEMLEMKTRWPGWASKSPRLPGQADDWPGLGVRIKIYVAPFCQWQNNQADSGRSHSTPCTQWSYSQNQWILRRFNSIPVITAWRVKSCQATCSLLQGMMTAARSEWHVAMTDDNDDQRRLDNKHWPLSPENISRADDTEQ